MRNYTYPTQAERETFKALDTAALIAAEADPTVASVAEAKQMAAQAALNTGIVGNVTGNHSGDIGAQGDLFQAEYDYIKAVAAWAVNR